MGKTICLNMIVKDESHVIVETLHNIYGYIPFDYYVISDTGSSDNTKDLIRTFFDQKGVSGEIHDDEWKDFGYNRSQAFKHAYNKTDYVFVWDADDRIKGDFKLPTVLEADSYSFSFGQYSRRQLFNNHKLWKYVGVLHECPTCTEPEGKEVHVQGSYHFESNRTGARNKDPLKYVKDGQILEKAFYEAQEAKDPIHERYAYYCANSYNSTATHKDKAIEFYKKVLTLNNWHQEKYNSCIELYEIHESQQKVGEALHWLVESHKYDATRIEGIYRLVKHYSIHKQPEVAMAYYSLVQNYYENHFLQDNIAKKLFVKRAEYEFFFPYYMIIVADRVKNRKVGGRCYEIIFERQHVAGDWWTRNLFTNLQFFLDHIPTDSPAFCRNFVAYVDRCGSCLGSEHRMTIGKVLDRCRPALAAPVPDHPILQHVNRPKPTILLSVTTCKRWDLFEQTVNSILKCWTDLEKVDYFLCVDDNSSEADRTAMATTFPFFEYVLKGPEQRGHRESMNIIWTKLQDLRPTYWIHMEDDWLFFKPANYVTRAMDALNKYKNQNIHQLVFNKNYGVVYNDLDRTGGKALEPGLHLHIKIDEQPGRHSGFWPHYSLQPSMTLTETVLALGNYDSPNKFFERDYANKWFAKGYQTMFFDSMYSIHIGKQHWEKEGKNAYALNEEAQFNNQIAAKPINEIIQPSQPIQEWTPIPYPCPTGSMAEHLKTFQALIDQRRPFALIRPSDGEHSVLKNRTLTNCDKWTFKEGGQLQKDLLAAVQTDVSGLYIGIPCNTCQKPWNCTDEIYYDYMDLIPQHRQTYANLFMNANWPAFIEHLKTVEQPLHVITSGTHTSKDLTFASRHLIDSLLVDKWDEKGVAETARVLDYVKGKRGAVICFSAGPLSKVWIPQCWATNPTNIYLDVGAALDPFTKGPEIKSRFYTNRDHSFAKEACVFKSRKSLIYMSTFHAKKYADMLRLLLFSIKNVMDTSQFDILILTDSILQSSIQEIGELLDLPLKLHIVEGITTASAASSAKLTIFEYPEIYHYERVLYLDTDIIIQHDISELFRIPIQDRLYAKEEGTIGEVYHGEWFFDFNTISRNTPAFNAGAFLFYTSPSMKRIFTETYRYINECINKKVPIPVCYEQPYMNYFIIREGKQNTTLFNDYLKLDSNRWKTIKSDPEYSMIHYICDEFNGATNKYNRMMKNLSRVVFTGSSIYEDSETFIDKTYTWGAHSITFLKGGCIQTPWGRGTYTWITNNIIELSWSIYTHRAYLNTDKTQFVSIRKDDCMILGHRLITTEKAEQNLIYLCVFHNKDYIQLLKLLLISIQFYSPLDNTVDILILTSPEFEPLIQALSIELQLPLLTKTFSFKTIFQAATARLHIFDYENIHLYTKILYLDTDILIKKPLQTLFKIPLEDKVYVLEQGLTNQANFGSQFFQAGKAEKGFNSGTLLFRKSEIIQNLFQTIKDHIHYHVESGSPIPYAMDQPFINYNTIKANLHEITSLTPYIALFEENDTPERMDTAIICHFSFPIGNFAHKYYRMKQYFKKLLLTHSTSVTTSNSVLYNTYTWNTGSLAFLKDSQIQTTWGPGTYKQVGPSQYHVSWNTYDHVIQFDLSGNYYGARIQPVDFAICRGSFQYQIFEDRAHMIEALVPKQGVYAEIGIFQGTFTKHLYETLKPSKFYLLDLFEGTGFSGDQDGNNPVSCKLEDTYTYFQTYASEVVPMKGDSSTQLATFEDNTFDMIYVDGDHSYQGCKKDLEVAYRKLKPGGLLLGHDYEMNMKKARQAWQFGVRQAVDEFCINYNQKIIAKGMDGCVSFAICVQKA